MHMYTHYVVNHFLHVNIKFCNYTCTCILCNVGN